MSDQNDVRVPDAVLPEVPAKTTALAPHAQTPTAIAARSTPEEEQEVLDDLQWAHAENTWRAYKIGWRDFEAFCQERGASALPAAVSTILLYVKTREKEGASISTLRVRLAAIAKRHDAADLISPTRSKKVKAQIDAIRNRREEWSVGKRAIDRELLNRMLHTPKVKKGKGRNVLLRRALLLLDWYSAMRRSELVTLRARQLDFRADHLLITLGVTKTSRGKSVAEQVAVATYPQDLFQCPVNAVRLWMQAAGVVEGSDDYLFPGRGGGHVSGDMLGDLVKRCVQACGLNPEDFSAHSMRAGFVTQMARDGRTIPEIQAVTRQSVAVVVRYIREADPMKGSAAAKAHGNEDEKK